LLKFWRYLAVFGQARRGTVALIIALSLPALLAVTGLAVDIGYWYQQQENLQSAADSAALSAAKSYINYNVSSLAGAEPYAVAAANNATNNQFGLTATTLTLSGGGTSNGADNASITAITATAKIPRRLFFSAVAGMGLGGVGAGYQYASATADVVKNPAAPCGFFNGVITVSGGGLVSGTNCAIDDNDTNCPSISVSGSGVVDGSDVSTAASCVSSPQYSGYIGNKATEANNGSNSTTLLNQAQVTDPLAGMGTPPVFPAMSTPPAPPSVSYTAVGSSNLTYNIWSTSYGNCTYLGSYTANCELAHGNYSSMTGIGVASLILNDDGSTYTTNISGGLGVNSNSFLTLNGNNYYVNGGMNLAVQSQFTGTGNFTVNGQTYLQNGSYNFGGGTFYLTGDENGSSEVTDYALNLSTPTLSLGAGTYYFNGGMELSGSTPTVTLGQGLYMMSAPYNTTTGALYGATSGTITFTGGTYFFNGGLNIVGGTTVNFGPGIYYIENGNLNFGAGANVTSNGATFVLEGNAGYSLSGGSQAFNLTAPTSNCVAPSSYPETQYEGTAPYDGTDGEGICGIVIYQARSDTTADVISEGAASTMNGSLYAPNAGLTVSGGATISITSSNASDPALEQTGINDSGSGTVNLTEPGGGAGNNNVTVALLVQ
jgi:Flp pilus assembly protein TadG